MSSGPNPPAEQPGANADQATPDGTREQSFLGAWSGLLRAISRDRPEALAAAARARHRMRRA